MKVNIAELIVRCDASTYRPMLQAERRNDGSIDGCDCYWKFVDRFPYSSNAAADLLVTALAGRKPVNTRARILRVRVFRKHAVEQYRLQWAVRGL